MANKQTAVEWLTKRCNDSLDKEPDNPTQQEIGYSKALVHFIILLEEAKQMEEEQIKEAYVDGCVGEMYELSATYTAEEYYNKTYANDTTKGLPEEDSKRRAWHY